jgi:hypothetical protein
VLGKFRLRDSYWIGSGFGVTPKVCTGLLGNTFPGKAFCGNAFSASRAASGLRSPAKAPKRINRLCAWQYTRLRVAGFNALMSAIWSNTQKISCVTDHVSANFTQPVLSPSTEYSTQVDRHRFGPQMIQHRCMTSEVP